MAGSWSNWMPWRYFKDMVLDICSNMYCIKQHGKYILMHCQLRFSHMEFLYNEFDLGLSAH